MGIWEIVTLPTMPSVCSGQGGTGRGKAATVHPLQPSGGEMSAYILKGAWETPVGKAAFTGATGDTILGKEEDKIGSVQGQRCGPISASSRLLHIQSCFLMSVWESSSR